MKSYRVQVPWLFLLAAIVVSACSNEKPTNSLSGIHQPPSPQSPPYFSGGYLNQSQNTPIRTKDFFDAATSSWSISQLLQPKAGHASIAVNNKMFWASGVNSGTFNLSNQVEMKDLTTGASSFACITPKHMFNAVVKNDNILFWVTTVFYHLS